MGALQKDQKELLSFSVESKGESKHLMLVGPLEGMLPTTSAPVA